MKTLFVTLTALFLMLNSFSQIMSVEPEFGLLCLNRMGNVRGDSNSYNHNSSLDYIKSSSSSATGFALSSNGYIATCNHVVDGTKTIKIKGINGDFQTEYTARIMVSDQHSDIAILKIVDENFSDLGNMPYTFKNTNDAVGTSIYTMGYPLIETMGTEMKLTDGIINAESGFKGDVTTYQISASVQPGNSGGPLFDKIGNVIGVVNAKHIKADNVTYAIKSSILIRLFNSIPTPPDLPTNNKLSNKSLPEQAAEIRKFVYIIEVY